MGIRNYIYKFPQVAKSSQELPHYSNWVKRQIHQQSPPLPSPHYSWDLISYLSLPLYISMACCTFNMLYILLESGPVHLLWPLQGMSFTPLLPPGLCSNVTFSMRPSMLYLSQYTHQLSSILYLTNSLLPLHFYYNLFPPLRFPEIECKLYQGIFFFLRFSLLYTQNSIWTITDVQ